MTYAELTSLIQTYLQSSEASFVAAIPTFVKQAERFIYDNVDTLPLLRRNATSVTTASSPYMATPLNFKRPFEFGVTASGTFRYLLQKEVSFIRELYPSGATGVPEYYALFDHDSFIMGPTPNAAYPVQLHYFGYPDSIVDTSTSWLGNNAMEALLYASLAEGYRFLKGDKEMQDQYTAQRDAAIAALAGSASKMRTDDYRN